MGRGSGNNPWQQVMMLAGVAALAGAGVGAASALLFAERRASGQDRELESLERRVAVLESGSSTPARRDG